MLSFRQTLGGIAFAAATLVAMGQPGTAGASTLPAGITDELVWALPGSLVTSMDALPDGRMVLATNYGYIWIVQPGEVPNGELPFYSHELVIGMETGIIGITADPEFEKTRRIYYTFTETRNDSWYITIASIEVPEGATQAPPNSFKRVFSIKDADPSNIHFGGGIIFDDDNKIVVGLGDDSVRENAQNPERMRGVILRLNRDGSVPADNPIIKGTRSPVYAYGLRNPFRLYKHPTTGQIYFSEVGENSWEEINRLEPAANYGWPIIEGFLEKNPGAVPPPDYREPLVAVGHGPLPVNSTAFVDGIVLPDTFPAAYRGKLLVGDWRYTTGRLHVFELNELGKIASGEVFGNTDYAINDLFEIDGTVYYLAHEWSPSNPTSYLYRFRNVGTEAAVSVSASSQSGAVPLEVTFTANANGGEPTDIHWILPDGSNASGTEITRTITEPGPYEVEVRASFSDGSQATDRTIVRGGSIYTLEFDTNLQNVLTGTPTEIPSALVRATRVSDGSNVTLSNETPLNLFLQNGKGGPVEILADPEGIVFEIRNTGSQPYRRTLVPNAENALIFSEPNVYLSPRAIYGRLRSSDGSGIPDAPIDLVQLYPGMERSEPILGPSQTGPGGYFYVPLTSGISGEEFSLRVFPSGNPTWYPTDFTFVGPGGNADGNLPWNPVLGLRGDTCEEPTSTQTAVAFPEVQQIFTAECIACHSGANPSAKLDLSEGFALGQLADRPTSTDVLGLRLVNTSDRTESFLQEVLNCPEPQAPISPDHSVLLSEAQKQTIADWLSGSRLDSRPLAATIAVSPIANVISPARVELRAGIEGGVPPYDVRWDFADELTEQGVVTDHVFYVGTGTRSIAFTATVTDSVGTIASASSAMTVSIPPPGNTSTIVPTFTVAKAPARAPFGVILDASDSTTTAPYIARYDWDFDQDGEYEVTTTEPQVRHQIVTIGENRVTLRIVDSLNNTEKITLDLNPDYDAMSSFALY